MSNPGQSFNLFAILGGIISSLIALIWKLNQKRNDKQDEKIETGISKMATKEKVKELQNEIHDYIKMNNSTLEEMTRTILTDNSKIKVEINHQGSMIKKLFNKMELQGEKQEKFQNEIRERLSKVEVKQDYVSDYLKIRK